MGNKFSWLSSVWTATKLLMQISSSSILMHSRIQNSDLRIWHDRISLYHKWDHYHEVNINLSLNEERKENKLMSLTYSSPHVIHITNRYINRQDEGNFSLIITSASTRTVCCLSIFWKHDANISHKRRNRPEPW